MVGIDYQRRKNGDMDVHAGPADTSQTFRRTAFHTRLSRLAIFPYCWVGEQSCILFCSFACFSSQSQAQQHGWNMMADRPSDVMSVAGVLAQTCASSETTTDSPQSPTWYIAYCNTLSQSVEQARLYVLPGRKLQISKPLQMYHVKHRRSWYARHQFSSRR